MPAIQSTTSAAEHTLAKRQYGYGYGYSYTSPWYSWGRWATLGVIIAVALLIFFLSSCINARRRKRRGATPMYGTGWLAANHGAVNYYPENNANSAPAPPYSPQGGQAQGYYNQSQPQQETQGYYGNQQNGIELQQPSNTYYPPQGRGGEEVYAPPPGPPPTKERVIR